MGDAYTELRARPHVICRSDGFTLIQFFDSAEEATRAAEAAERKGIKCRVWGVESP